MSDQNSIVPFSGARLGELHETVGITQQPPGDEDSWYQIIGGLIFQGGVVEAETDVVVTIPFVLPLPKKVLTIQAIHRRAVPVLFVSSVVIGAVSLIQFDIALNTEGVATEVVNVYWLAVGY